MHFLIIGVGSIGERHLRNFLRIPGVRCSVAEPSDGTRRKIAAEYQVEAAYADYRETDLADYDGVVICVPANLHVPIAKDAISAGTHVLTEKPLAMSLDGVEELKRLRDEKGVVASVAFTYRSDPLIHEVRDIVRKGKLGAVRLIHGYSGQYWPRMRKDYPPKYAQSRETGGGVIPDCLVHTINYLEWVFGPAEEVAAKHWRLALNDIATEDTGFVSLRFAGGVVAQIGTCLVQRDTNSRLQFVAERGTIQMRGGEDALEIFHDDKGEWSRGEAVRGDRDDIFRDQAAHFIECIRGEAEPRCTLEQGEQTLRTVLAALASADGDGGFVKVSGV